MFLRISCIKCPENLDVNRGSHPGHSGKYCCDCCGSAKTGDLMKSHQWTQEIWKGAAENPGVEQSNKSPSELTAWYCLILLDIAWLCMPCRRCQHCQPTYSNKVSFVFFVLLLTPWYSLHHFTSLFLVHMIHIWLQFIQHTKLVWNLLNQLKHPPCLHYIRLDSTDSSCPPMHYQELMTDVCDAQMPFAHLTDLNRPGNMWHMISRSAVLEDKLSFSSLPDLFVLHGWSPSLGIWGSGTELQTWFLFVSPFSTWGSFEV